MKKEKEECTKERIEVVGKDEKSKLNQRFSEAL